MRCKKAVQSHSRNSHSVGAKVGGTSSIQGEARRCRILEVRAGLKTFRVVGANRNVEAVSRAWLNSSAGLADVGVVALTRQLKLAFCIIILEN